MRRILWFGLMASGVLAGRPGHAQDKADTTYVHVGPDYFWGDKKSVGGTWEVRVARSIGASSVKPPATLMRSCLNIRPSPEGTFDLESTGALALDPDANPIPLRLHGSIGRWWSLYKPGCPSPNPNVPPVGGWYYGSVSLSLHVNGEGNQRLTEAAVDGGLEVLWTHSRATGNWRFVPSIDVSYDASKPVESALRDSLNTAKDPFQRAQLHAAWHIPLPAHFRLHANGRVWRAFGLASPVANAGADEGWFTAVDLGYAIERQIGRITLVELFVRRIDGKAPTDWQQREAWMIGLSSGK